MNILHLFYLSICSTTEHNQLSTFDYSTKEQSSSKKCYCELLLEFNQEYKRLKKKNNKNIDEEVNKLISNYTTKFMIKNNIKDDHIRKQYEQILREHKVE
ncbi:uncharacterized protein VNE69_01223 [Vairimorpha necatrix]|uniref:Uncharacterized protein n=1 Tax=Vairimorpha necatrix TaxID=6039 RepID=A0AAX4J8K8_9MICR